MADDIVVDDFPKISKRPMTCCGMLEAWGFSEPYQRGTRTIQKKYDPDPQILPNMVKPDPAQVKIRFERVLKEQTQDIWRPLNCALISLANTQLTQIKEAEAAGFKKVFEFYNPNSGNMVGIYTHTLWKNEEEFLKSMVYRKRYEPDLD